MKIIPAVSYIIYGVLSRGWVYAGLVCGEHLSCFTERIFYKSASLLEYPYTKTVNAFCTYWHSIPHKYRPYHGIIYTYHHVFNISVTTSVISIDKSNVILTILFQI